MQRLLEDALRVPAFEQGASFYGNDRKPQAEQRAQAVSQDLPGEKDVGNLNQGKQE